LADIWNNDEVRQFLADNGFIQQYNDGLTAYLRAFYLSGGTLAELVHQYINEYGTVLIVVGTGNFITAEDGDILILEDGDSLILED
jgi:hypothetical protein